MYSCIGIPDWSDWETAGFGDEEITRPEIMDWGAEYKAADYHPETGDNYKCHQGVACDSETPVVEYAAVEEEDGKFAKD